jgi:hypothetical protein
MTILTIMVAVIAAVLMLPAVSDSLCIVRSLGGGGRVEVRPSCRGCCSWSPPDEEFLTIESRVRRSGRCVILPIGRPLS